MKRTLIRLGLTALVSSALFGCGGGSDGVDGSTVTVPINVSNPQTVATNASPPSSASVQAWQALQPKVTVMGVSIHSPPVVKFAVTDAAGNAVIGLGNKSKSATATVAGLTNLSFTLAKLVPATSTAPSKWVSYLVVKPPTVDQSNGKLGVADSCTADFKWCGTYPTADKEGTLVDNGDGTYQYTFARDITQAANIVASLVDTTDSTTYPAVPAKKLKADLGDVSYDPSLTHRLGVIVNGTAPGTGSNTPTGAASTSAGVNMAIPGSTVYDFVPNGGAVTSTRSVVDISSCASCHNGKGIGHSGSRKDPNLCVTCHTDQIKYGMSEEATRNATDATKLIGTANNVTAVLDGRAIGNYPNLVHKIHMGDKLGLTGYNYRPNASGVGHQFEKNEWIQDPRDCTKCHSGVDKTDINQATKTKDGDNWKTQPSRLACGSCHDDVSFTAPEVMVGGVGTGVTSTGLVAHPGGMATDDASCASCHAVGRGGLYPIDVAHRTELPTANNPVVIDGISTISYEIQSVKLNASRQPVFVFRVLKDSSPVMSFNIPTTVTTSGVVGVQSSPVFQPITGFTSGPSFYVTYAVPQDGINNPADFNTYQSVSLTNLLVASGSPKAGTISGTVANGTVTTTDANGWFTATLTGDTVGQALGTTTQKVTNETGYAVNRSAIVIPAAAKMVTGAMIGTFTQRHFGVAGLTAKYGDLTAAGVSTAGSVSTGLIIKSQLKKVPATLTGNVARRVIVDIDKCESCHEQLGSAVDFHSGARNDPTACAICHTTSKTSNGWSANASTYIHGIHAGTDPITVTAGKAIGPTIVGVTGGGCGGAGTGNPVPATVVSTADCKSSNAYSVGKRIVPFSWARDKVPGTAGAFNAAATVYPGILKRCDNCHVPNAVNFGANGGADLLPNLLWSTSATNTVNSTTGAVTVFDFTKDTNKNYPRDLINGDPTKNYVTYITADGVKNYGNVFSFTPQGAVAPRYISSAGVATVPTYVAAATGTTIQADPETLVESPITSACFACHDSSTAKSHMTSSFAGGVIYGRRGDSLVNGTLVNKETCLVCHGQGRDQDVAAVHAK